MNILQINSVCGIGSTGRIATDLHAILKLHGHRSTIAYGRDTAINCDQTIRIGKKINNYYHVLNSRLFDKQGYYSSNATKAFIEKIKMLNPDVIHLHNLHGYYLNFGLLFKYLKQAETPIIWTLHDCWAFTGHCTHYDYIGCEKWKDVCYRCAQKQEYPKSMFRDRSRLNYQLKKELFKGLKKLRIVTPSNWLSNQVGQSFLKEYPVEVINNGIDVNVFRYKESDFRSRYDLHKKYIILGVASVWTERKGLQYFIEMSKRLNSDEKIVLVGLNKKQIKQLPEGVIGIEKTINASELANIYSESDIYINPTLEDNYPTTNLEALACGTPVVTFNSGGSSESIGVYCGVVVKRGDFNGLIEGIVNVKKKDKNLYKDICRKHAIKMFDKSTRFEEYIRLYKNILYL
jgi:putative colanic acid biosynthesis glycosyltransferase